MDRFAILVDAGYFFAAGAHVVHSRQVPRRNISLASPENSVKSLCERGAQISGVSSLLRVYWYDAMQGPRLSLEQTALAKLAGVKLRLGSLNSQGEQKGVDSLMVTDLIELARNRAISDAVVISGDEDLRVAVQVAQTFGVRVHLLAVGDAVINVSNLLQMEADSVDALDSTWVSAHLTFRVDPVPQAGQAVPAATRSAQPVGPSTSSQVAPSQKASAPANTASLDEIAGTVSRELLAAIQANDIEALRSYFESNKTVPPEFDRKLIAKTGVEFGRFLTSDEKRRVRGVFVGLVRKLAGPKSA